MIRCHRQHLYERCIERGYSLEEVMPCVAEKDGDMWLVDESHSAYPRQKRDGYSLPEFDIESFLPRGPGTELKKLLKKVGIEATPTCSCNARARVMDERGIEWCEANIDQIVGWLREEATNRGLPFVDMAGRMLVKRAIRNAKRA